MKLIGGNFGADGKAQVGGQNLIVNGQTIGKSKIESMSAVQQSTPEFSIWVFLSGLIVVVPIGLFLFGIIGALAALILTVIVSLLPEDRRIVTINIEGGKSAVVQCKKKEAQRLMALAP